MKRGVIALVVFGLAVAFSPAVAEKKAKAALDLGKHSTPAGNTPKQEAGMKLGNFSVSLAVKDLAASKLFYEKLGFVVFMGDQSQSWLIMKNGDHNIGLFQGMFEKNILTFNPGWSSNAQPLKDFTDVRELQRQLKKHGLQMLSEADESTSGPASFMIADPDGNTILMDQHL